MARQGDEIQIAGIALFVGGGMVWAGLRAYFRKRKVEDTQSTDIASAPQGQVEIQGYAWPVANVCRTLESRKALYHHLVLEKHVKRGKNSSWETQWDQHFEPAFYVVDKSGIVLVNPKNAELQVRSRIHNWNSLSESAKQNAQTYGINVSGFPPSSGLIGSFFSSSFRFRESMILLASPVYVHGTLSPSKGLARLPPTLPLQRFREFLGRFKGNRVAGQMTFDTNKDGVVCEDEARDAVSKVAEHALEAKAIWKEQPPLPGAEPEENRIFGQVTSCSERKLYIADCHQEHLLKRLGSWNVLLMIAGACVMGFGVFIIALKLGL